MSSCISRRQWIIQSTQASCAMTLAAMSFPAISSAETATGQSLTPPGKDATPRQVAESYWRAECARDIEAVGRHYHSDAIFMPPGERLVGWEQIRPWYEQSFHRYPGLEVHIAHEIHQAHEAALEWQAVLIDPAGTRHPLTGVNIVRVQAGQFREVRAYFDSSMFKTP